MKSFSKQFVYLIFSHGITKTDRSLEANCVVLEFLMNLLRTKNAEYLPFFDATDKFSRKEKLEEYLFIG